MRFPIQIAFKILAIAPQLYVTDAGGNLIGYVKQKLLRLKESVTIFADEAQTQPIYSIEADRIIDFSANYAFSDASGRALGSVKRYGMRSLWRAHYVISVGTRETLEVHEQSAFVRLIDSIVGDIPIVGLFTGLFFHPVYLVSRVGGPEVLRMTKRRALLESLFTIDQEGELSGEEQQAAMLGLMMIVLLERSRG